MARRRNPFNATKPAEWATMSKKLRKSWNRRHWRPDQWKCDLALKKEATRQANRSTRAGRGLMGLAEKMLEPEEATNPGRPKKRRRLSFKGLTKRPGGGYYGGVQSLRKNPARRIPLPFKSGERISGSGLRAAFKKAFPYASSNEITRIMARVNPARRSRKNRR